MNLKIKLIMTSKFSILKYMAGRIRFINYFLLKQFLNALLLKVTNPCHINMSQMIEKELNAWTKNTASFQSRRVLLALV